MNKIFKIRSVVYASLASLSVLATTVALPSFTKNNDPATLTLNSTKIVEGIRGPYRAGIPDS
ncbi:hypothetical protein HK413_12815 [Mucilaginibacter sp. S1162]|uniref:Uncharacterized protein n=1 Tax=Mucilaginibacter humi TaxID=2732510 RepID=A0ABX1W7N0_9SPHI|nr:hypothetical protein [Mucilaginibacter humi]NNU34717.1 hypothetical protein [Mucilaginibacter humi]